MLIGDPVLAASYKHDQLLREAQHARLVDLARERPRAKRARVVSAPHNGWQEPWIDWWI